MRGGPPAPIVSHPPRANEKGPAPGRPFRSRHDWRSVSVVAVLAAVVPVVVVIVVAVAVNGVREDTYAAGVAAADPRAHVGGVAADRPRRAAPIAERRSGCAWSRPPPSASRTTRHGLDQHARSVDHAEHRCLLCSCGARRRRLAVPIGAGVVAWSEPFFLLRHSVSSLTGRAAKHQPLFFETASLRKPGVRSAKGIRWRLGLWWRH